MNWSSAVYKTNKQIIKYNRNPVMYVLMYSLWSCFYPYNTTRDIIECIQPLLKSLLATVDESECNICTESLTHTCIQTEYCISHQWLQQDCVYVGQ